MVLVLSIHSICSRKGRTRKVEEMNLETGVTVQALKRSNDCHRDQQACLTGTTARFRNVKRPYLHVQDDDLKKPGPDKCWEKRSEHKPGGSQLRSTGYRREVEVQVETTLDYVRAKKHRVASEYNISNPPVSQSFPIIHLYPMYTP